MPEAPFRRLAIGVLVNDKTLHDEKVKDQPKRFVDVHNLATIFQKDPLLINIIHLSLEDKRALLPSLERLTMLGGSNLHGFQLNVVWPDPSALCKFRKKWLKTKRSQPWLILQISKKTLEEIDYNSVNLCKKLLEYKNCITDVLIDPSGGKGELLDIDEMEKFIRAITFEHPGVGIGIAGGLTAENIKVAEKLMWQYPNLSIGSGRALSDQHGSIEIEKAKALIKKVFSIQECFID